MARKTVALCRIEANGNVYNYGDEVPEAVADSHPEAVGEAPLTSAEINSLNKAELQAEVRRLAGITTEEDNQ